MKLIPTLLSAAVLLSSQSHAGVIAVQYDASIVEGGTGAVSGTFQFDVPSLADLNYLTGPTEAGHNAINNFTLTDNPITHYSTHMDGMAPMTGTASQSSGYAYNTSSTGVMADGSEVFEMGFSHDLGNGDDISFWIAVMMPDAMYDFNFDNHPEMVTQAILDSGFLYGNAFYSSTDYNMIADISSFSFSLAPETTSLATADSPATRVPDPESLFLFATGLVALYFSRRRLL